jgi:hypothetical protein
MRGIGARNSLDKSVDIAPQSFAIVDYDTNLPPEEKK